MVTPCYVPAGVITGEHVVKLLQHARDNHYALPAFSCSSSSAANAVMEAASKSQCPVVIQASYEARFFAGKSIDRRASTAGCVALALHVRAMAPHYGIPVVLHSEYCGNKLVDGMLDANAAYFSQHGQPLFSSLMLDLSGEPDDENVAICAQYFRRMARMKMWLEMKIEISGRGEDGVDASVAGQHTRYTCPGQEVWNVYKGLSPISDMFSIAVAFSDSDEAHNLEDVKLSQKYVREQLGADCITNKPLFLVMDGSESFNNEVPHFVEEGVVKVNIDTDALWAFGVRSVMEEIGNVDTLEGIGNPQTEEAREKDHDARAWIRKVEKSLVERCRSSMVKLGCSDTYPRMRPVSGSIPLLSGSLGQIKTPIGGVSEMIRRLFFGTR